MWSNAGGWEREEVYDGGGGTPAEGPAGRVGGEAGHRMRQSKTKVKGGKRRGEKEDKEHGGTDTTRKRENPIVVPEAQAHPPGTVHDRDGDGCPLATPTLNRSSSVDRAASDDMRGMAARERRWERIINQAALGTRSAGHG